MVYPRKTIYHRNDTVNRNDKLNASDFMPSIDHRLSCVVHTKKETILCA